VEAAMTDDNAGFDEATGAFQGAGFNDGTGAYDTSGLNDSAGFDEGAGFNDNADDSADFDESFFATLESGPDADTVGVADNPVADEALDFEGADNADGAEEFQYEAEGDGSFETDALEFDTEDFPFDLGGEA
jgi:hypothetical protein